MNDVKYPCLICQGGDVYSDMVCDFCECQIECMGEGMQGDAVEVVEIKSE